MIGQRALALLAALALLGAGCASRKYVNTRVGESETRSGEQIDQVVEQVETNQTRLGEHETRMNEISKTAAEALERAIAAGRLAQGRFLYETILSEDGVQFGFEQAELTDAAAQALDAFAADLKAQNENVFIEIQGHTDSTGSSQYNLELGQARAESVRRYLNLQHGLPLHRMSVISYGESEPLADNRTRDGRAKNRRVSLVVLK